MAKSRARTPGESGIIRLDKLKVAQRRRRKRGPLSAAERVHAFIERDEHLIRPLARGAANEIDAVDELLAAGGVERRQRTGDSR